MIIHMLQNTYIVHILLYTTDYYLQQILQPQKSQVSMHIPISIKFLYSKKVTKIWKNLPFLFETPLKVSKFQNENMRSSHCPKYEQEFFKFFRSYFGQCNDFIFSFWNLLTFRDPEKLFKFEAEGWEFENILRSLEQTVKGQNNFW